MRLPEWAWKLLPRTKERVDAGTLPVEGRMPGFEGATGWLNSAPLAEKDLRGKVVLVDFWTYSCINCIRTIPHLNAWHEAYADQGFVIIGVHTPEFDFEKDPRNVAVAIERFGIRYPVAIDNDYALWNAYNNHYWPAHYFIDGKGSIRYHHFGEGEYGHSEAVIVALLRENGIVPSGTVMSERSGATDEAARTVSPETYLGFDRMEYLGSPESVKVDAPRRYSSVPEPGTGAFYLEGAWEIRNECAVPTEPGARIVYKVRAATANLVMDPAGQTRRILVSLDRAPVGMLEAGSDVSPEEPATVIVDGGRLYNLFDLHGRHGEHLLEVEFPEPGVRVYAFTFG